MASRRDMQDIMGLPLASGPKAPTQKRPKPPGLSGKRMSGISREVVALMGERPPPVAIYDEKNMYKSRRHTGPAKKWAATPFHNPARRDGLILRHWRRKQPILVKAGPDESDVVMEDLDGHEPVQIQSDYEFSKYNVQADVPHYTDEQYEGHLQNEDWSKEETDYLFELVKDYSYRWPAIWDRYDFEPTASVPAPAEESADGTNPNPPSKKERTMEELKARFYAVQAILMKLKTPIPIMTAAEFTLHEQISSYNIKTETDRKALATALLTRSREDVIEEEFLLVELQRICASTDRLEAERDDIRHFHEVAPSDPTRSTQQFQTFQSLNALFQQLFTNDKNKKRQSTSGGRLSINTSDLMAPGGMPSSHRDSLASASASAHPNKKGAASHPPIRNLAPAQERRFGVTSHDRLQSGVSFRSDKLLKMRQAKSQAQTTKLQAALTELGIPDATLMCSGPTLEAFERMVQRVGRLLEVRKLREKEDGEIKTVSHMLNARRRELAGEKGEMVEDESEIRDGDGDTTMKEEENDDEEEENENENENEDAENKDEDDGNASGGSDNEDDADGDGDNDVDDTQDRVEDSEIPDLDAAGSDASDAEADNDNEDEDPTVDLDDEDAEVSAEEDAEEDDEGSDDDDAANVDDDDADEDADVDVDADGETETANTRQNSAGVDALGGVSTRLGTKRSASVMSGASSKASKRTRNK